MYSLLTTGNIYGAKFCYHDIPEKLDLFDNEAYESNSMEFHVVCTDVVTGKPVYKKCDHMRGDNIEFVRGSASLPLVSRIVKTSGYKVLDGGISDSVPIKYFENIGYDRNVVILTRPYDYVKGENETMPYVRLRYKKYPNFVNVMENRHVCYNETLAYIKEKEAKGEILVIRPSEELPLKHMERDPEVLDKVYGIGRETALGKLDEIRRFLDKC
jgi:predicted patatin/cPLA2 family phospholipase